MFNSNLYLCQHFNEWIYSPSIPLKFLIGYINYSIFFSTQNPCEAGRYDTVPTENLYSPKTAPEFQVGHSSDLRRYLWLGNWIKLLWTTAWLNLWNSWF